MAKYIFTSGKRKGKVNNELYRLSNGENLVVKNNLYCPVNTKWLSKEEFKQYILQLIRDEYPNYLVVDELPEELDTHIIYFLKQVNPDQSVYYDVYVYDEEQLKHIVFKGADIPELEQIKQVVNDIVNYSLKNVYNVNLPANRVVITDTEGNLRAGNTDPVELDLHLYWSINGSLKNIYDKILPVNQNVVTDANGYLTTTSSVKDCVEVRTSLPSTLEEDKLYFISQDPYIQDDHYKVYTLQNSTQIYLGCIQHGFWTQPVLYLKRARINDASAAVTIWVSWIAPNSLTPTFKELWDYLGSIGSVNFNNAYPATGFWNDYNALCVWRGGTSSNMTLLVYTRKGTSTSSRTMFNSSKPTINASATKIL